MNEVVKQEGDLLIIATSSLTRFLTLFSYDRNVVIDPNQEVLSIHSQLLYFIKSVEELRFEDLWYLDYEYTEARTQHSTTDYYTMSVVTQDEKKYKLCVTRGQQSSHLALGVHLADGSDDKSRELLTAVSEMIGIPIGKPIAEDMEKIACVGCGREITAITKKCMYCGAVQNPES